MASLSADGSLSLPTGEVFPQPHLWVNACWEKIGHRGKRTKKSQAYKMVSRADDQALHVCRAVPSVGTPSPSILYHR